MEIDLEGMSALCTHALSTLLHYVTMLEHDWCPVKLGLLQGKERSEARPEGTAEGVDEESLLWQVR